MELGAGAVLVLMGISFAIGWFWRSRRSQAPAAAVPAEPSAEAAALRSEAYNDGYRAGYVIASAAVQAGGTEAVRRQAVLSSAAPPQTPRLPGPPPEELRRPKGTVPRPLPPQPAPAKPVSPVEPVRHVGPALPPAAVSPGPKESAAIRAVEEARKTRRDLRNINIALYAACLLLVAAASLFIGLAIPASARFAGVSAVAGLFYAGGLAIHARSRRLRPAGVAFTGTGLALIPVVGLALNNFVLRDAPLAWLATSVVGTAAFAYAAAKLDSAVVAYLSMTFLLSTALASGAAMRSGIVWYFLCTVLLATVISLLALRRPVWLNNLYLDAFVRSHRFLVPATAAVAAATAPELGGWQFSFLFLSFAGYYAVLFLQGPRRERLMNSYGFRITATAGLTVLGYKLSDDAAIAILVLSLLLLFQAAGLLAWRRHYDAVGGRQFFGADLTLLLCLQATAGVAAGIETSVQGNISAVPAVFTVSAVLVLMTFMAAAWKAQFVPSPAMAAAVLPGFVPRLFDPWNGSLWTAVLLGVLLTVFLVLRAVSTSGAQRRDFIYGARVSATGLVPVLAVAGMESAGLQTQTVWTWTLALTVAAVLLNQVLSVCLLRAGRPVRFAEVTVGAAFGLVPVLTVWLRFVEAPGSVLTLSVLFCALAVNVLTPVLLRRFFAAGSWLEWVGPGGFAAAALAGAGLLGVRGYEVLVGAAVLYCGFMALRWAREQVRGSYLLAGQVLLTVLVALVVADLDLSVHGVFVAVAVSVAAQQMVRTVFQDRFAGVGLDQLVLAAQWGSVGVLVLLPLAYLQLAGSGIQRHVVAVPLALLLSVSLTAFGKFRSGNALYAGVYALGALPVVLGPVIAFSSGGILGTGPGPAGSPLSVAGACAILLVLGAGALVGGCRQNAGSDDNRSIRNRSARTQSVSNPCLVAAGGYPVLVLALAVHEGLRLFGGLALVLLAAGMLCVSFTRKLPWLAAAASGAVLAASFLLYGWIVRDILAAVLQPGTAQLWPGFAAALALYAVRSVCSVLPQNPDAVLRQRIFGSSASVIAAGAGIAAMSTSNASAVYGSAVLIFALAAAVLEVPPPQREDAAEAGALVGALAVQRILWFFAGDIGWFWSVQFWVVVLAALAGYEFYRQRGRRAGIVLAGSAALLSCTGLTTVASADVAGQVWTLLAHAGLLAFGVLSSRRLFTVWGAAGVAVAVLWYLRGYTFLLLALLAAALIILAIWRLNRVRSDSAGESAS